jgi:hypothetical protein
MKSTPNSKEKNEIKAGQGIVKTLWRVHDILNSSSAKLLDRLSPSVQKGSWNEKTVEYHFARFILPFDALAAPLAASEEEMFGDLIVGPASRSHERLCLVEFKAVKDKFNTEYEKYFRTATYYRSEPIPSGADGKTMPFRDWFNTENQELARMDASNNHYFIYGDIKENDFVINFESYKTDSAKQSRLVRLEDLKWCNGIDFGVYLLALATARVELPPGGDKGPAFYAAARATVIEKLSSALVLTDSGRYMPASQKLAEIAAVFEKWLDLEGDELQKELIAEFSKYITKKPDLQSTAKGVEAAENILKACRIKKYLSDMKNAEKPREMQAGR